MSRSSRGLIRSALALALVGAFIPAAQAYQTPKPHHHRWAHIAVRHPGDIYVVKRTRSYLDPGTSADYTSNLYFEDTRSPHYLLGPGILQRFDDATGMY